MEIKDNAEYTQSRTAMSTSPMELIAALLIEALNAPDVPSTTYAPPRKARPANDDALSAEAVAKAGLGRTG